MAATGGIQATLNALEAADFTSDGFVRMCDLARGTSHVSPVGLERSVIWIDLSLTSCFESRS